MTNNNWNDPNDYWYHQPSNNQQYNRYSRISITDAMSIAMEQVPGEVEKAELDAENGMLFYEVGIRNMQGIKYEVLIDARTGSIINIERD